MQQEQDLKNMLDTRSDAEDLRFNELLAAKLNEYWANRGYAAKAHVVKEPMVARDGSIHKWLYCVRWEHTGGGYPKHRMN